MTTTKSRGLGKGLEALFNDVEINIGGDGGSSSEENRIVFVEINRIKPNANQPRTQFDEEKIQELANSIETHGVIQPILVRRSEFGYEIVAGERRWRAARKAGLREIPCILREISEEQNMLIALIENMQRENLNPIEEAAGLQKLIKTYGLTQELVAKNVGKSRPYITNSLRLLKLPNEIQEMVSQGRLSGGHARAIAGMDGHKKQLEAAERCLETGWSVRDIEKYAGESADGKQDRKKKPKKRERNREILSIEEELKEIFGTRVNLNIGVRRGKIEIEYYNREELERLLEMLYHLK